MALNDLHNYDKCALVEIFDRAGISTEKQTDILGCSVALIGRFRRIIRKADKQLLREWYSGDSDRALTVVAIEASFLEGE